MPNTSSDIVKIALLSVIPYFFYFFCPYSVKVEACRVRYNMG